MTRLGTNLLRIGGFNERVVINALRRRPGLSQTELAGATGLAIPTVAGITRQLMAQDIIRAAESQPSTRGRPRIPLFLNGSAGFGLGVHLDPTQVSITLLDLAGHTREVHLETGALTTDPDIGVVRIADLVNHMIQDAGIDRDKILGVGVATPGPIDFRGGRLVAPPWLPGWEGYPLVQKMASALELDILFEKDTIAAITGERWLRVDEDDTSTMVFVYQGIGLGLGLAVGGHIVRGSSGNAGDVSGFFDGPRGARNLELARVDPAALCFEAISRGVTDIETSLGSAPVVGRRPSVSQVDRAFRMLCALADSGDATCLAILREAGADMAHAVKVVADLIDADHIVLGGPYWDLVDNVYGPLIQAVCSDHLSAGSVHTVSVSRSVTGTRAGAIGAAALVLDDRYVPHPASLAPSHRVAQR